MALDEISLDFLSMNKNENYISKTFDFADDIMQKKLIKLRTGKILYEFEASVYNLCRTDVKS